mmetsp:Transcript_54212/g.89964  ORF Transcript_54212/g.89964 Transcript_54212/m.89964 type:complete len:219 (+) Transcript_54212:1389-2045(+)
MTAYLVLSGTAVSLDRYHRFRVHEVHTRLLPGVQIARCVLWEVHNHWSGRMHVSSVDPGLLRTSRVGKSAWPALRVLVPLVVPHSAISAMTASTDSIVKPQRPLSIASTARRSQLALMTPRSQAWCFTKIFGANRPSHQSYTSVAIRLVKVPIALGPAPPFCLRSVHLRKNTERSRLCLAWRELILATRITALRVQKALCVSFAPTWINTLTSWISNV